MNERIMCAANYYDDGTNHAFITPINKENGFIISGLRHCHCIEMFAKMYGFPYSKESQEIHNTEIQGFLTNLGRFVDRKEAYQIALKENQIIKNKDISNGKLLYSENLY